jgi:hypothetical protein
MDSKAGAMDQNLRLAIERALNLKSEDSISFARQFSWEKCALKFKEYLVEVEPSMLRSQEEHVHNLLEVFGSP